MSLQGKACICEGTAGKPGDPRLGSLIVPFGTAPVGRIGASLVWFPFDEGTVRNSGRDGGRDSASLVAQLLPKMGSAVNPEEGVDLSSSVYLTNAGQAVGDTLEAAHISLEGLVGRAFQEGTIPIVVGGSNDQSYCNASAWLGHSEAAQASGTVINIDAHLDVRPPLDGGVRHSGSPFYCLVEDSRFKGRLVEFAAQGHQCSKTHADYVTTHGGSVRWLSELRKYDGGPAAAFESVLDDAPGPIFVSFDVDSINARDMPGVSCPSNIGLTSEEALSIARMAGRCPKVDMLDLSELNVGIESDRSVRLVVCIIYNFLLGLAERSTQPPLKKSRMGA